MTNSTAVHVLFAAAVLLPFGTATGARGQDAAQSLAPWLDLPAGWSSSTLNGILVASPGDVPAGAEFFLLVEPVQVVQGEISSDYEQAVRDLGPWTPVGAPTDQRPGGNWRFRLGVGVAELNGRPFTSLTAVARLDSLRARFWVLADTDATYNRYQADFSNAIASVQDFATASVASVAGPRPPTVAPPAPAPPFAPDPGKLDPGFGEGLSGVYAGWTRGLSAGAGVGGLGPTYDPRTGRIGAEVSAANPTVQTTIGDFEDLVLLLPDGTFRQGLPLRGLDSDLRYDRQSIPSRWGTWTQEDGRVVVQRSGTTAVYAVRDEALVDGRDRPWVKVAPPAARAIEGTYVRADFRDPGAPRLVLRSDGSYEDRGGFLRMVSSAMSLVVPDGGALVGGWSDAEVARWLGPSRGTYVLKDFTLTLRTDDGRVWQVSAHAPPGGSQGSPDVLVIGTYRLVRS